MNEEVALSLPLWFLRDQRKPTTKNIQLRIYFCTFLTAKRGSREMKLKPPTKGIVGSEYFIKLNHIRGLQTSSILKITRTHSQIFMFKNLKWVCPSIREQSNSKRGSLHVKLRLPHVGKLTLVNLIVLDKNKLPLIFMFSGQMCV